LTKVFLAVVPVLLHLHGYPGIIEVEPVKSKEEQRRVMAVQRFRNGEKPESICASLGRSKVWLYKWIKRRERHGNEEPWSKLLPASEELRRQNAGINRRDRAISPSPPLQQV